MPKPRNKTQYEILSDVKYFEDITTLQIIMAIHRTSGSCFQRITFNQGEGIKENFVSGFLTAFSSFETVVGLQLGKETVENKIKAIKYGDFTISIVDGEFLRIALISENLVGNILRDKCFALTKTFEKKHEYDLKKFTGECDTFNDVSSVVEKEIDIKLNYKSKINKLSLEKYDAPRNVKNVLSRMLDMNDIFYPAKLPSIFTREADQTETMSKFYTYNAYLWYVFEPVNNKELS